MQSVYSFASLGLILSLLVYNSYGHQLASGSCVHHIPQNKLFGAVPVVVHQANPLHLIGCLEFFCHAVDLRHASNDRIHHRMRLFIYLAQMLPKLTAGL